MNSFFQYNARNEIFAQVTRNKNKVVLKFISESVIDQGIIFCQFLLGQNPAIQCVTEGFKIWVSGDDGRETAVYTSIVI